MDDSLHQSFQGISVGRTQPTGGYASGNSLPARSSAPSFHAETDFATFSGAGNYGNAFRGAIGGWDRPQQGNNGDMQSASARFERFFAPAPQSSGPSFQPADRFNGSTSPFKPHSSSASGASHTMHNGAGFGGYGNAFHGSHGGMTHQASGMSSIFGGSFSGSGAIRGKHTSARQGLPSQWGSASEEQGFQNASPSHAYGQAMSSPYGVPGSAAFVPAGMNGSIDSTGQLPSADDDIIPTAIVVKNIPFSIKREQLLSMMEGLLIPMPYAFNYHFDQGVFRGLAFANFRSGEEADAVVAALNGFDVAGRKLRVEYKKVLQAGEKERIEKDKAIKRMQSMQLEKERLRRQTVSSATGDEWPTQFGPLDPYVQTSAMHSARYPGYDEANGLVGSGSSATASTSEGSRGTSHTALTSDNLGSLHERSSDLAADAASELGGRREDLDLNDPNTLEIYSRVLLFKDDRMRDELTFSKSISSNERRIVRLVAKRLDLYHYSMGEGDERFVTVVKKGSSAPSRPLRNSTSTIGRAGRTDGNANVYGHSGAGQNGGRSGLRTKKSAPDMKRPRDRSEDAGAYARAYGGGRQAGGDNDSVPMQNGFSNGLSRKSNTNLRESYNASLGRRSHPNMSTAPSQHPGNIFGAAFDIPPVPALPGHALQDGSAVHLSHTPSPTPIGAERANSAEVTEHGLGTPRSGDALSAAAAQQVLRQPAGPTGTSSSFAQRSRVPLATAGEHSVFDDSPLALASDARAEADAAGASAAEQDSSAESPSGSRGADERSKE